MNFQPSKRHVAGFFSRDVTPHFFGPWFFLLFRGVFVWLFCLVLFGFLCACMCSFVCLLLIGSLLLFFVLFVLVLFCGKYPGGSINFCTYVALKVQAGSNAWYPSTSPAAHGSPLCQCCVLSTPWGRRRAAQPFDGTLLTLGSSAALGAAGWCAP